MKKKYLSNGTCKTWEHASFVLNIMGAIAAYFPFNQKDVEETNPVLIAQLTSSKLIAA